METIQVELPKRLTTQVKFLVQDGWFADENEVIRAALLEFLSHNHFELTEQFQREDIAWALEQHRSRVEDRKDTHR
jgi:Arc/MetJ-type ribon-helix-helix transcriptional regulator